MIDVIDYADVINEINTIINNGGTCEVKLEHNRNEVVVVEINRRLKMREKAKKE